MISASEALERLREGNRRFASGDWNRDDLMSQSRNVELLGGQSPFAIILGCSDSRVPVEIVFDQGFGDLFVIRVGGNVAGSTQIGSIEYAVEQFGTRLVVVLGHSQCGAVIATIDELLGSAERSKGDLRAILDRIRPPVESVMAKDREVDRVDLLRRAVRANVRASVGHLRRESELLEHRSKTDRLLIVGAEYSLETGVVDFFEGAPEGF